MESTNSNGTRPERRDITAGVYGVKRHLPGGGWVRVLPRIGNVALLRRRDALLNARRAELGLALEAPLPPAEALELTRKILLGPVITGWGEFVIDGREIASPPSTQRPDVPLDAAHEAAGLDILGVLELQREIYGELDAVDQLHRATVEEATGNSSTDSATN